MATASYSCHVIYPANYMETFTFADKEAYYACVDFNEAQGFDVYRDGEYLAAVLDMDSYARLMKAQNAKTPYVAPNGMMAMNP